MSDTSQDTPRPRLSPAFRKAFEVAAELHAHQERKGSGVPYVAHLMGVTSLVLEDGGSEIEAIAALLHDAVEDQPRNGETRERIGREFGHQVLEIVLACSDAESHPKPPWRERKERYLAHIPRLTAEARRVSLADKVHNARSLLADYRRVGEEVWKRFNAPKGDTLWYYRALVSAFRQRGCEWLLDELERTVVELERLTGSRT
ncbi:MAG: HD domain-containing protein [Gemmatimonadetes bacterium]|nr:HD domain-containing protein [Gemmatimonadota bacterium]